MSLHPSRPGVGASRSTAAMVDSLDVVRTTGSPGSPVGHRTGSNPRAEQKSLAYALAVTSAETSTAALATPLPAWRAPVTWGAAALAGTAAVSALDPTTTHVPLCPFHSLTGLDCPACGSLRAVFSLTRGDVAAASSHNLLFTLAAPLILVAWVGWVARSLDRPLWAARSKPTWLVPAAIAVAVGFTVARNLPALAWLDSA